MGLKDAYRADLMMITKAGKLKELIEAARSVRKSLIEYDNDENATGEIFYAEMMCESIDLLVEALDEYETTNE